jgi:serralysin
VLWGVYDQPTNINLAWNSTPGNPTSARGFFVTAGNVEHELIVNGRIENVRGSDGSDVIAGNDFGNRIYGDWTADGIGGNDTISGGEFADTIYGGAGADLINGLGAANGYVANVLFGGAGSDTIYGGTRSFVAGGAGADVLVGSSTFEDGLSYIDSDAGVQVTITPGTTTTGVGGHAAGDQITD